MEGEPGRGPSPSHHVSAVWLRPECSCTSLQFQRGSAQVRHLVPSQGCPGRSGRSPAQGPPTRDTGTQWPLDRGSPAPPRASPGTARTRRCRSSLERPPRTRTFRPPLSRSPASPSAALPFLSPNGRLSPVRSSPPGRRHRRRCRRRCSYHQISRDFAPPRAHPPPARTRRAPTPAWNLREVQCPPRGVHNVLLFSQPASARARDPEKLKPRCEAATAELSPGWPGAHAQPGCGAESGLVAT